MNRSQPPAPGMIRPFDFPTVESERFDNGLTVLSAPGSKIPLVAVTLVLEAGESSVTEERAGSAVLAGDALEGGTARRSGTELAEALESIGASLSISTGWDATTLSVSCLADRLEEAVDLLSEIVLEPTFPEAEVDRIRDQRLAAIEQRRMDPSSLAADSMARFLYADGVAYGRPLGGTSASVSSLSREDLRSFWAERFRPDRTGAVIVGEVDSAGLSTLLHDRFGHWNGSAPAFSEVEPLARANERTVYLVDRPDAVQSEIRIAQVGVPRSSSDFFSLKVWNGILGGMFTSRLNLNLREQHGFTYGVRSRFDFRRSAGPFSISTAVQTEVTVDAIGEALKELSQLVADGPTAEEVRSVKDYLIGVFPLGLQTADQLAGRIGHLMVHRLPDDYYKTYRDRIREISVDVAADAGRRCVHPDELAIVVVGDAARLRGPLEVAQLGPVLVHEVHG